MSLDLNACADCLDASPADALLAHSPLATVLRARCISRTEWAAFLRESVKITMRQTAELYPFIRAAESRMVDALERFLSSVGATLSEANQGATNLDATALLAMLTEFRREASARALRTSIAVETEAGLPQGTLVLTARRVDPDNEANRRPRRADSAPRVDRAAFLSRLSTPKRTVPTVVESPRKIDDKSLPVEPCSIWLSRAGRPAESIHVETAEGQGVWSCCGQRAPNDPGCESSDHAFDVARCRRCGLWVHPSRRGTSTSQASSAPPTPRGHAEAKRHSSVHGRTGSARSSPRDGATAVAENKHALQQVMLDSGCRVRRQYFGRHCPMSPPADIESGRCGGCANDVRDARCVGCESITQMCMRCFVMVPIVPKDATAAFTNALTGRPLDSVRHLLPAEDPTSTTYMSSKGARARLRDDAAWSTAHTSNRPPAHACYFHPGVWTSAVHAEAGTAARTSPRTAKQQLAERAARTVQTVVCPHTGCGFRLLSGLPDHTSDLTATQLRAHASLHAERCGFAPVPCSYGCNVPRVVGGGESGAATHCWRPSDEMCIVRRRDLAEHVTRCPDAPRACPNREYGCDAMLAQRLHAQHVESVCGYTRTACERGCGSNPFRKDRVDHARECRRRHMSYM